MTPVTLNGQEIDFDAAVNLMDDDIREELYLISAYANEQAFLDAYARAHRDTFGKEFAVN